MCPGVRTLLGRAQAPHRPAEADAAEKLLGQGQQSRGRGIVGVPPHSQGSSPEKHVWAADSAILWERRRHLC